VTTWGIRNDLFGEELFTEGFVSIGWGELGDLAVIGSDQESLKAALVRAYPDAKPGAIPVWAGVLRRFAFEMQVGDHLIAPYKADGTLNFGVVAEPYEYRAEFGEHPHRRRVKWVQTGVPRGVFPQPALYELGASMTLFKVAHNEEVFADYFTEGRPADDDTPIPDAEAGESADEWAREEPNATKLEQFTRDFVLRTLVTDLDHREFEEFTGALLRAMGYQARVTQFTADGGIDLIAHRDPTGAWAFVRAAAIADVGLRWIGVSPTGDVWSTGLSVYRLSNGTVSTFPVAGEITGDGAILPDGGVVLPVRTGFAEWSGQGFVAHELGTASLSVAAFSAGRVWLGGTASVILSR